MLQGDAIARAKQQLAQAGSLTVLTGAGISADSGVPTFRGPDGLWNNYRAEDLATPEAFERDPRLVWEWYNWRREIVASKQPNPAHYALTALEQRVARFWLITQNVDGLHQDAGSRQLSELHGNIWKVRCTACTWLAIDRTVPLPFPPLCTQCGSMVRPHIVWFGEPLPADELARSQTASESCQVFLIIGTSGLVYPAAFFAPLAKAAGAYVIEINRDPTPYADLADLTLLGRAAEIVPLLL